ncbi:antitoxin VapB family protein [Salinilacihabitans rarus]|uniref:antitoxin VapB family protein n=1 Tax=Salinilacihabitans rarus TaxID=2961596 RepID=UPI0020C8897E|nr:antitoxin VapB family protein [Salinilacihabitans rarus]
MGRKADTHIRVTEETWKRLNNRKRPGDSFDDVIERLLEDVEANEESEGNDTETDGGDTATAAAD